MPTTELISPQGVRHRFSIISCLTVAAAVGAALLSGCASDDSAQVESGDDTMMAAESQPGTTTQMDGESATSRPEMSESDPVGLSAVEQLHQDVESRYIVGPAAAREFGYRIDWQNRPTFETAEQVLVTNDALFIRDTENILARVSLEDGSRSWHVPIAKSVELVLGMAYIPGNDRVYVMLGGHLLEYEAQTGNMISKQKLAQISATGPTVFGRFVLYGSRGGQLIWHSYGGQVKWRGYEIAPSTRIDPIVDGSYVVFTGTDGHIMTLHAPTASQLWRKKLLDDIVTAPAVGAGAVIVASRDQHIRAYDIQSGRRIWAELTKSPLTDSPTLIGDVVYQQIEAEGLACFEAQPFDSPGGVRHWTAPDVHGNVITKRGGDIIVWDDDQRVLSVVDPKLGAVVRRVELPRVDRLLTTSTVEGALFGLDEQGTIIHLVPRN